MTVPAPSFAFCDITLMRVRGVGVPCYSLVRVKVQAPYSAFTVVHVAGATVFSVLHGWRRAVGVSVVFCFVVFAPFLVLWLKERAFSLVTGLLVFLICASWHFWISGFFISMSDIYEARQKSRELTTLSFLEP